MQEDVDPIRRQKFSENLKFLKNPKKELKFPDYNKFPYQVREIFEYFKAVVHKEDLLLFAQGKLFKECIINVYLKIHEKIN
jgi:hypothetical protein